MCCFDEGDEEDKEGDDIVTLPAVIFPLASSGESAPRIRLTIVLFPAAGAMMMAVVFAAGQTKLAFFRMTRFLLDDDDDDDDDE